MALWERRPQNERALSIEYGFLDVARHVEVLCATILTP